jgi:hypothetical protein
MNKKTILLIAGLCISALVIVSASFMLYPLWSNRNHIVAMPDSSSSATTLQNSSLSDSSSSVISHASVSIEHSKEIIVSWLDTPQKKDVETVLRENGLWDSGVARLAEIYRKNGEAYWKDGHPRTTSDVQSELKSSSRWYLLGAVRDGEFAGSSLYNVTSDCLDLDDMCIGSQLKILITNKRQLLQLSHYSGYPQIGLATANLSESSIKIANMDTPDVLQVPGSSIPFKAAARTYLDIESGKIVSSVLTDAATQTEVHLHEDSCFVGTNHDGSLTFYNFDFPKNKNGSLDITWDDGKSNTYDYSGSFSFDGCNAPKPCNPETDLNPSDGYEKIGKTSWGEPVYRETLAPNTTNEQGIKKSAPDTFEAYRVYNLIPQGQDTFKKFYDGFAVIYFKDPFGKYMKFLRRNYEMQAQGCEPANDYR